MMNNWRLGGVRHETVVSHLILILLSYCVMVPLITLNKQGVEAAWYS